MLDYAFVLQARGEFDQADTVLKDGAERGWAPAQFWFAQTRILRSGGSTKILREMRPMLEQAAAQGSLAASWLLARKQSHGRFGILQIPGGFKRMATVVPRLAAAAGVEF